MKEPSLSKILLDHINQTPDWKSKGSLYVVGENEGFSPEYVGRELRTLAEESKILVSYYKGKRNINLARYARIGTQEIKKVIPQFKEILIDNIPTMIQI